MKVKKMLLREETEKVLHTKSNGDKLVSAASGDGYTAFTKDDVHIGHISAETDATAIAEFSKKEPKYEALDMSQEELIITAERYLDLENGVNVVEYSRCNVDYTRKSFVAFAESAYIDRIVASKKGVIVFIFEFETQKS